MNAFDRGRIVEARAMEHLLPFLTEHSNGRFVLTGKGRLAKYLQETVGDMLFNARDDAIWSVEIKAELKTTGNLFLEIWSNRNLEDRVSHSERGSNPGWLIKTRADLLFYYFLDTERLYIADSFRLKRWAFSENFVYKYPMKCQGKYDQGNDTWGCCVPISDLINSEVRLKLVYPRQLELIKGE